MSPCIKAGISYYIIPIWNWSPVSKSRTTFIYSITLFLYGIGAYSVLSINPLNL